MAGTHSEALCYRITLPKGAQPHLNIGGDRSTLVLDNKGDPVLLSRAKQKVALPMWPGKVDLRTRLAELRFAYSEAHNGIGPPIILMFETTCGLVGLIATCSVGVMPSGEVYEDCFPFEAFA